MFTAVLLPSVSKMYDPVKFPLVHGKPLVVTNGWAANRIVFEPVV